MFGFGRKDKVSKAANLYCSEVARRSDNGYVIFCRIVSQVLADKGLGTKDIDQLGTRRAKWLYFLAVFSEELQAAPVLFGKDLGARFIDAAIVAVRNQIPDFEAEYVEDCIRALLSNFLNQPMYTRIAMTQFILQGCGVNCDQVINAIVASPSSSAIVSHSLSADGTLGIIKDLRPQLQLE